jgi:hypothetical protein
LARWRGSCILALDALSAGAALTPALKKEEKERTLLHLSNESVAQRSIACWTQSPYKGYNILTPTIRQLYVYLTRRSTRRRVTGGEFA